METAERRILGALLSEPGRWQAVQTEISVEDFAGEDLKRLAEKYWDHQRDEGEPVFNEFLSQVGEESLSRLAVEIVNEVGEFDDLGLLLREAVKHLAELRHKREEQQRLADASRGQGGDDPLKLAQERARRGDLRRIGR